MFLDELRVRLRAVVGVVKALPIYGALGNDQLDDPELFFYSPGHNAVFPVNMIYFDESNNTPKVRLAIRPISRLRLDENHTYETLTTIGGDPAPDDAVEELTGASFVPASYDEHNQHLNRPARKNTTLFIVNPDHPVARLNSAFHGEPLRCNELIGIGAPRGGLLPSPCEAYVGTKEGIKSSLPHDPGTNQVLLDDEALREDAALLRENEARLRENEARSRTDRAYTEALSLAVEERERDMERYGDRARQLDQQRRDAAEIEMGLVDKKRRDEESELLTHEAEAREQREKEATALD